MDFKKRIVEELGMTGHASSHLWDGYVDICEKIAKEYHNEQLNLPLVIITEGESCKCGNKTFTHRHTNWIECTSCNKIKVLQD